MDWVDHIADQTLLCNVDTLRLKVVAPSAQSMGEFLVRKFDSENPPGLEETPESEEAERIISRLRLLPGLRHFVILKHTDRDAEANDRIFEPIFSFIIGGDNNNIPLLESLTLHNHKIPLSFLLPSFHQNLRAFNLTGFSVTGPDVAREALRRLPKLKELVLVGPPPGLEFLQRPGYRGVPVVQSITPEVIASLRELRALSLHELDGGMSSPGGRLAFFTADMLDAVMATHHRSLRHLSLQTNQALKQQQQQPLSSSSSPPSESNNNNNNNNEKPTDVLKSIKSLLRASHSLETVSLAWYDLNPTILHFLPPSLQHLEIPLPVGGHHDDDDSDALFSTLIELHRSNCLPHLRSVMLRYYTRNSPVSMAKGFMPTPARATGQPARRPLIEVVIGPVVRAQLEGGRRRLMRALGGLRVDVCRWELGYEDV